MSEPQTVRVLTTERVRAAFERRAQAVSARPAVGQGTAVTTVRVLDGLACEVEEGDWHFAVDMGEKGGGSGTGPNPGVLGRAALGSCVAMSIVRWAAHLDIPLTCVEVEVQADYDARGEYGVDETPPGYSEVRTIVTIESEAPEAEVCRLLDLAERHTPYVDVFRRAIPVKREVWIARRRTC